jgi:hypothetical protein
MPLVGVISSGPDRLVLNCLWVQMKIEKARCYPSEKFDSHDDHIMISRAGTVTFLFSEEIR